MDGNLHTSSQSNGASFAASAALARVANGDLCAGCGACASLSAAVEMRMADGFLRPEQSSALDAEAETEIAAVCPGLSVKLDHDAPIDDVLWGPIRRMEKGHATDPAFRHEGASGGGLSALLAYLLENQAVDFVIHVAADPDNPVGNRTVISRTAAEVLAAAGSRYAPSAPLAEIGEIAADAAAKGEKAAFAGKPCDAAALRAMMARDETLERTFPYVLSFFCAGVPSEAGAHAIVRKLGFDPKDVAAFRYRGQGWPGRATATAADGRSNSMTYMESWGEILSRHVQFRCKVCADGIGSFADVAAGDAWESDERGYPKFEELAGESLLVARTAKGEALLDAARAAGAIESEPMDLAELDLIQPGQFRRRTMLSARLAALGLLGRPKPAYQGFHLAAASRRGPKVDRLRNFLGIIRRHFGL